MAEKKTQRCQVFHVALMPSTVATPGDVEWTVSTSAATVCFSWSSWWNGRSLALVISVVAMSGES